MTYSDYRFFINKELPGSTKNILHVYILLLSRSDKVSLFLFLLRTSEYLSYKKGFYRILYTIIKFQKWKVGLRLGFTIPEGVFDYGLQIPHYGTIIVNANARVGKNCRIHACTNIGASGGNSKAPQIGDNVYIAPGVKIYGDITIASNTTFAANAAVGESIHEEGYLVGGVPAKIIRPYDNGSILKLKNESKA